MWCVPLFRVPLFPCDAPHIQWTFVLFCGRINRLFPYGVCPVPCVLQHREWTCLFFCRRHRRTHRINSIRYAELIPTFCFRFFHHTKNNACIVLLCNISLGKWRAMMTKVLGGHIRVYATVNMKWIQGLITRTQRHKGTHRKRTAYGYKAICPSPSSI